jgi:hypothetical protein
LLHLFEFSLLLAAAQQAHFCDTELPDPANEPGSVSPNWHTGIGQFLWSELGLDWSGARFSEG